MRILFVVLSLRRFVNQVHKLIQLWRNDDLRAAVALFAHFRFVRSYGVIFSTSGGRQACGVYAIIVLQGLHNARSAQTRQVPVVANVCTRNGHRVCVTFDQNIVVAIVFYDLRNLA